MGGLLHLVQRGGDWAGCGPASPIPAVPNVTAHPSTTSVLTSYYSMWHLPLHSKGLRFCVFRTTGRPTFPNDSVSISWSRKWLNYSTVF